MSPKSRRCSPLVVPVCRQLLGEDIIVKLSLLLEALDTFGDFKVHPTFVAVLLKVVLVDEFLWDLVDANASIFWTI